MQRLEIATFVLDLSTRALCLGALIVAPLVGNMNSSGPDGALFDRVGK